MNTRRPFRPHDMNPDPPSPPSAARVPRVSIVHGTELVDPYAWLRDPDYPEVSDSAILDHLNAENAYVESLLRPHEALVESLLKELRGRIQEADESVAVRDGDYFYQWRFSEGDEYRVHYRRHVRKEDWEVLLDERILADGHDYFRLGGMDVSDDSLLAFSTDTSGDERYRMRFRNLHDGSDLHESIPNTIDEPIWLPGTREILYVELSDEWRPYRVRLHAIGTSVEDDPILYEEADEGFFVSADLSQDRRWIIITAGDHETTEVHVLPASVPRSQARLISPRRRGHQYHVDHAGTRFYILTNDTAVNFRLVSAPEDDPGEDKWAELIPGRTDVYLHGFTPFAEFMLIEERANAVDRIVIRTYGGESHEIVFPESICAAHEGENPEFDVQTVQIRYESMITPPTVYDYHVPSRELTARKTVRIPSGYDRDRYRTERLLVPARDGSTVPVSIVYRADFPRDGSRYVHLYGYGAYGYGQVPGFSRNQLSLLDRGFAFAIAHVRGGDELGYGWYLDGKLMKRWNTFTDFVDTARHLVDAGYTSAGRICISGGSAGGELIGVVLNEAPELWAAAVAHVPFVDVTNTMLDASLPLTPMEWPEWGNPVDDRPAFEYISSYSPYDNVREQEYPPLFVTAGLNDPRVTYWEPAKWVARLRYRKTDDNVLLLKTNMGAGHAGKSGRFQHLREAAEELAFLLLATSTKP